MGVRLAIEQKAQAGIASVGPLDAGVKALIVGSNDLFYTFYFFMVMFTG